MPPIAHRPLGAPSPTCRSAMAPSAGVRGHCDRGQTRIVRNGVRIAGSSDRRIGRRGRETRLRPRRRTSPGGSPELRVDPPLTKASPILRTSNVSSEDHPDPTSESGPPGSAH